MPKIDSAHKIILHPKFERKQSSMICWLAAMLEGKSGGQNDFLLISC